MEPLSLVALGIALVTAVGVVVDRVTRPRAQDTEIVVDDRAEVEAEVTQQLYSYERAVNQVCGLDYVQAQGEDLCRDALCWGGTREDGGGVDEDQCDRDGAHRVRHEARQDCRAEAAAVVTMHGAELADDDKAEAYVDHLGSCLTWYRQER